MSAHVQGVLIRVVAHALGPLGVLLVTGGAFGAVGAVATLVVAVCAGCSGALIAFGAIDIGLATPARVTVTGHHWLRKVYVEVAERDERGELVWERQAPVERSGDDLAPLWPIAPDDHCAFLGCRRPGTRSELYTLNVAVPGRGADDCTLPRDRWIALADGAAIDVSLGRITGAVYCTDAKVAAPSPSPSPERGRKSRRR
ncbi:MAG: hypothetical protein ABMB14_26130 [Myxococcota bacterium]